MQYNRGGIVQIYAEAALPRKIMSSPRRSYAQLQQALALAEAVTERTLCEMLALRQSQQGHNSDVADKPQTQQQLHQLIKQSQRTSTGFAVRKDCPRSRSSSFRGTRRSLASSAFSSSPCIAAFTRSRAAWKLSGLVP